MKYFNYVIIAVILILLSSFKEDIEKPIEKNEIPASYSNIKYNDKDELVLIDQDGKELPLIESKPEYIVDNFSDCISADGNYLLLDLGLPKFNGTLYFGLYPNDDATINYPVFFKTKAKISSGKAKIDLAIFKEKKYDIGSIKENKRGRLGYRIADHKGSFIYDGKVDFLIDSDVKVNRYITRGPFLNKLTDSSASISFKTNKACRSSLEINNKNFVHEESDDREIKISGLEPNTKYEYTLNAGDSEYKSSFTTNPEPGSQQKFSFGYLSDSREGPGGGERAIFGVNAYIIKKMAALARAKDAKFCQFTGDMINGYQTNNDESALQYTNWLRAIEPYLKDMPWYVCMGNHETLDYTFDNGSKYGVSIDKFPFAEYSAEVEFSKHFCNFDNGPESEDGSKFDPSDKVDFPSYKENVFHYTYGNIAMVVLNSNYWYAPGKNSNPFIDGNLHGYLMDNQMKWLQETLAQFESNPKIDHIFVTLHTPVFPNGGHSNNDMWYLGENSHRARIAGKSVEKGIIERRDEFLDLVVNKSSKVVAVLCGDEHNYSRTRIDNAMPRYLADYKLERLELKRSIWQITNGAAGAPYYSQEELIWSGNVEKFSAQYALVLFHVDGDKIEIEVINPDTLEEIERHRLK
jgi:3',5'-cyclic AMP phosphodiesterase CpdA